MASRHPFHTFGVEAQAAVSASSTGRWQEAASTNQRRSKRVEKCCDKKGLTC
jgi:hypothetical protein